MDAIHIDRLTFKVSGITEAQGRELAESVARDLAASSAEGLAACSRGAIRVSADLPAGGDIRALSERIVRGVLEQLRRST